MTQDDLLTLADNATFLYERLDGGWLADESPANRLAAQARLERWRQLAGGGDADAFARRLAWLGLSLPKPGLDAARALPLLCDGHLADRHGLPEWTSFLAEALTQPADESGALTPTAFVQPFVTAAQARLNRAVGERLGWLSPPAQSELNRYLAERLAALADSVLNHHSLLFERHAICRAYPVVARQLCTAALHWQENAQEFLDRLAADWPALADHIRANPSDPCPSVFVSSIHPGLSDPHRGGRTVWRG